MKHFFLLLITSLYMILSTGFAIDIHHCMGKVVGMEWHTSNSKKCITCGMIEKKNGCCKDELKFFKLEDSHKKATYQVIPYSGVLYIENNNILHQLITCPKISITVRTLPSGFIFFPNLFILYRNLRI